MGVPGLSRRHEQDVPLRVLRCQVEQLRGDEVAHLVVQLAREEQHPAAARPEPGMEVCGAAGTEQVSLSHPPEFRATLHP